MTEPSHPENWLPFQLLQAGGSILRVVEVVSLPC